MDRPRRRRNSHLPWKPRGDDGACRSSGGHGAGSPARLQRTLRLPWLAIAVADIVLATSISEPTLAAAALIVGLVLLATNVLH